MAESSAIYVEPVEEYALQRGFKASTRLNCQYLLWRQELGFDIHPTISKAVAPKTIADVGTGTGIWLLNLAKQFPDIDFHGFDISLAQVPPQQWLPKNVTMKLWDMYTEVPEDLLGKFDVVHVRLMLLVVRNNDPLPVLQNLMRLLKPGGYLQWDELDVFEAYVVTVSSEVDAKEFQRSQELADFGGLEWVRKLEGHIGNAGFEAVEVHQYECDMALIKFFQDMQMMVMEEEITSLDIDAAAHVTSTVNRIWAQARKGAARCVPKKVAVARKP